MREFRVDSLVPGEIGERVIGTMNYCGLYRGYSRDPLAHQVLRTKYFGAQGCEHNWDLGTAASAVGHLPSVA